MKDMVLPDDQSAVFEPSQDVRYRVWLDGDRLVIRGLSNKGSDLLYVRPIGGNQLEIVMECLV